MCTVSYIYGIIIMSGVLYVTHARPPTYARYRRPFSCIRSPSACQSVVILSEPARSSIGVEFRSDCDRISTDLKSESSAIAAGITSDSARIMAGITLRFGQTPCPSDRTRILTRFSQNPRESRSSVVRPLAVRFRPNHVGIQPRSGRTPTLTRLWPEFRPQFGWNPIELRLPMVVPLAAAILLKFGPNPIGFWREFCRRQPPKVHLPIGL